MFNALQHSYLVPFNGSFRVSKAPTQSPKKAPEKKALQKSLEQWTQEISELQHILYAHDHRAILLIFQAMDAAGKDSTIRAVMSGVNPAGCQVFSFKQPSAEEIDHDFLWRTSKCLPERGRIGIFNRSYYEETLIVRVHPEILGFQRLPQTYSLKTIWKERFDSIIEHERHLARNGTVVIKFWLNVSRDEQKARFLARLDAPEKNWKFSAGDVKERDRWEDYMKAYESTLNATSRPWAPWYAIPADNKAYMRSCVAEIVARTMQGLKLKYPKVNESERARFDEMRKLLAEEK